MKTTLLVLAVAVFAIGCKGQEASPDSGAIDPNAASIKKTNKPALASGGGPATMNAKSVTPGPGAGTTQFGQKAGGN